MNRAGGLAFTDSPRMALYRQIATSLWSGDGYYEKQQEWFQRFQQNVVAAIAEDIRFPFALAAYARDKQGLALRTSPISLFVEAATNPSVKGTGIVRQYATRVLRRADEPAEAIAYFKTHHKGVLPHGLLRGIADTLRNFDEYQLGKYKETGAISMRDVFRLARPKPRSDEERALWAKVVAREIAPLSTWEVELSQCKTDEAKRDKWNELIRSGKLGLFALVRNVRNIVKYGADIEEALSQITPDKVKASGILPFQWYKAYKALNESSGSGIAQVMEQALAWSLAELPRLAGTTLVACDNSGSMSHVSPTRGMSNAEIGNLLGAMVPYCCERASAGTFGESFAFAQTHPDLGIIGNKHRIDDCGRCTGHATNAWTIFEKLIRERIIVDRVILLSDMQCYDSNACYAVGYGGHTLSTELDAYRQFNPNVVVYSINLASQDNTSQFAPHQPVVALAGFSESVLQFIGAIEAGRDIVRWITAEW